MTTQIISVRKADEIHNKVEGIEIHITENIPSDSDDTSILFDKDARVLAKALADNLPGGVFDRLLSELLTIKSCQLRVPHRGIRC